MRKFIFLDIDGVLNTKYWSAQKERDEYGYTFDVTAVANLAKIIEKTGADVIISSSWKCMGLSELRKMWEKRQLPGRIVDVTPDYMSDELLLNADLNDIDVLYNRGIEIKGWMEQHGESVSQYVIVDDMDDILPEQQSHFVQTDPEVGISDFDAMTAIMILNAQ